MVPLFLSIKNWTNNRFEPLVGSDLLRTQWSWTVNEIEPLSDDPLSGLDCTNTSTVPQASCPSSGYATDNMAMIWLSGSLPHVNHTRDTLRIPQSYFPLSLPTCSHPTNSPCHIPCMQCVVLSLLAPSHDDNVLGLEWNLEKNIRGSQLFLSGVKRDPFLFTKAKNNCDPWLLFLRSHSTSKTLSSWEGARRYEIICCVPGIWQGLPTKECTALAAASIKENQAKEEREEERLQKRALPYITSSNHGWRGEKNNPKLTRAQDASQEIEEK